MTLSRTLFRASPLPSLTGPGDDEDDDETPIGDPDDDEDYGDDDEDDDDEDTLWVSATPARVPRGAPSSIR